MIKEEMFINDKIKYEVHVDREIFNKLKNMQELTENYLTYHDGKIVFMLTPLSNNETCFFCHKIKEDENNDVYHLLEKTKDECQKYIDGEIDFKNFVMSNRKRINLIYTEGFNGYSIGYADIKEIKRIADNLKENIYHIRSKQESDEIKKLITCCLKRQNFKHISFKVASKYNLEEYYINQCKRYSLDPELIKEKRLGTMISDHSDEDFLSLLNKYFKEKKEMKKNGEEFISSINELCKEKNVDFSNDNSNVIQFKRKDVK